VRSDAGSAALPRSLSSSTVHQVDLFTVREKEAKCLAPRLTGQDNSFPVVLENYSSEGVFTRRPLLILGTVFIATCTIKASNGLWDHGCVAGTCVCVCVSLNESSLMAVSSVSKSAILSIINISEPVSVLANLSLPSLEHSHTHLRHK